MPARVSPELLLDIAHAHMEEQHRAARERALSNLVRRGRSRSGGKKNR
jgi:hypothetical protein